jgi:uncharacterized Ntn-hydrolase superfamily protein
MNTRKLLTLPYRAYRAPLAVLDARVATRLPSESAPRLVIDRVLGSYDQFAGRLLKDTSVYQQGAERIERTRKITDAVALERRAAERRATAESIAEAGEQQAEEKAEQAVDHLAEGLDAAEETERRGKQAAAERARSTAAQRKQAADAKASQRLKSVEQSVERTETAAQARTRRAQDTAKAKLSDVADERAEARSKRSDAAQLDSLVEAKKAERTAKR